MAQRANTDGAVGTALDSDILTLVYIIRLDVVGDPLFAWTGFGDLVFAPGQTGDAALDGQTFQGITHLVAEVGAVQDGRGGSSGLELSLPGVDLTDEMMRQVVYDARRWQFQPGRVWMAFLDADENIIGKPIRIKSGKMDQMPVEESEEGVGIVKCVIESAQAYSGDALATRYSEQVDIDPSDNSQRYVWALANMTPGMGVSNAIPGATPSYGMGDGGFSPGGGGFAREVARAMLR